MIYLNKKRTHSTPLLDRESAHGRSSINLRSWSQFPLQISQRKRLLMVVDLVLLNLAVLVGLILNGESTFSYVTVAAHAVLFSTMVFLWWALSIAGDGYEVRLAANVTDGVKSIIKALLVIGAVIHLLLPLLVPSLFGERTPILRVWILAMVLLSVWRVLYATLLVRPSFQRRILVVGAGRAGRAITQIIEDRKPGYEIVGHVSSNGEKPGPATTALSLADNWTDLAEFVRDNGVSDIVLAEPNRSMDTSLERAMLTCFEQGVRIVPMAKLFEEITGRVPVEHLGHSWLLMLPTDHDSSGLYLIVKRAMDIVISTLGLISCAPLFLVIAAAIKLDSPGPVFYRPERLGLGGKPFRVWKFRTMVSNADRIGDPTFTAKNDSRITRVGRIARLAHLDELPQFFNVLMGDMSVVGPRPERYVPELEESIPFYRTRYAVKPGATGLALVKQGYAEGVEGTLLKLQYDLYYIKHQSLFLDLLIMFKSVVHMMTMRGQ